MKPKRPSTLKIADIKEGDSFEYEMEIKENLLDEFIQLTGDSSTIHVSDEFAIKRGFKKKVVHGLLLGSFLSTMVGMYFPGENAILQTINFKFLSPAYINDKVKIILLVEQVSLAVDTIVLKFTIKNIESQVILVSGKIQVGFTQEMVLD